MSAANRDLKEEISDTLLINITVPKTIETTFQVPDSESSQGLQIDSKHQLMESSTQKIPRCEWTPSSQPHTYLAHGDRRASWVVGRSEKGNRTSMVNAITCTVACTRQTHQWSPSKKCFVTHDHYGEIVSPLGGSEYRKPGRRLDLTASGSEIRCKRD